MSSYVISVFVLVLVGVCLTQQAMGCTDNEIQAVDPYSSCSTEYRVCEQNVFRRAMCVNGYINLATKRCEPSKSQCPDLAIADKAFGNFGLRKKRQATVPDCTRSFLCPADMTNVFIYPDWQNRNCDSYVVCWSGELIIASCKADNYTYYNPNRLSCEETASPSNTCVFREYTIFP
ncbi:uncharacterized protein LOC131942605 [Physella acuta]|uniref:uncharacterized protein LOC131942605 n=1 Tax=Physella acuta TaxID=109671 RepID=UPI0027DD7B50|nr:uncharacterized protein LOC131942605 [Physella acuta]